jgi:hypothetical protein
MENDRGFSLMRVGQATSEHELQRDKKGKRTNARERSLALLEVGAVA